MSQSDTFYDELRKIAGTSLQNMHQEKQLVANIFQRFFGTLTSAWGAPENCVRIYPHLRALERGEDEKDFNKQDPSRWAALESILTKNDDGDWIFVFGIKLELGMTDVEIFLRPRARFLAKGEVELFADADSGGANGVTRGEKLPVGAIVAQPTATMHFFTALAQRIKFYADSLNKTPKEQRGVIGFADAK